MPLPKHEQEISLNDLVFTCKDCGKQLDRFHLLWLQFPELSKVLNIKLKPQAKCCYCRGTYFAISYKGE